MSVAFPRLTLVDGICSQSELILELQQSARMTKTDLATLPGPLQDPAAAIAPVGIGNLVEIELPKDSALKRVGFNDVLEQRHSIRFWDERPVELEILASILRESMHADHSGWPGEVEDGSPVELLVIVRKVVGVQPGVYRFGGDSLIPVSQIDDDGVAELVLQIECAWAPIMIVPVISLRDHLRRWGDHGDRMAAVRSGAAVSTALLSAASFNLAGVIFAGVLATGFRSLIALDGYKKAVNLAVSLGYRPN